jgi:hypothetical protein
MGNTPDARILCLEMRRLPIVLALVVALLLPTVLSAATTSDGTLSVKRGRGKIVLKLRGTVIGSMANGTVRIRDQAPGDGQVPHFRHCRLSYPNLSTTVCKGRKLSFRALDGRYVVTTKGGGTFLSAVGHGTVMFDGAGDGTLPTGVMSFDGDPYQPIPIDPTTYQLGTSQLRK